MAKRYLGEQQDVVLFETFTAASFSKVMKRSSWIFSFFFPHFIKTWIRLRLVNKDVNQTVFCSSLYSWTRHGWSLGQSIAAWKMKENCVHCQRRSFKSCEIICQALQSINISVMRRRAPPPPPRNVWRAFRLFFKTSINAKEVKSSFSNPPL